MADQSFEETDYGFRWGTLDVTRIGETAGRGRVVQVASTVPGVGNVQIWVSEGGKSIRVWFGHEEVTPKK